MKPRHAVSLIESAYRWESPTQQWLEQIAASAATALESRQAMAFRYGASEKWVDSEPPALHGLSPKFAFDFFNQGDAPPEISAAMARVFLSIRYGTLRVLIREQGFANLGVVLDRYGIDDMVGVNGLDPSGRGCMLAIAVSGSSSAPRTAGLWHRLAAHISAGNRLRATVEKLAAASPDLASQAEAVLTPEGKIEHAIGAAEPRAAREALRDALVRIDAARSEKDDAGRSVELWRALVSGRWSLVEHFERDGKRYFLAHKNDPKLSSDRALIERERQVLGYAKLGNSNKLIAYSLGLSTSTVSALLARARKRLGESEG